MNLKFHVMAMFADKSTPLGPGKCPIFTAYRSIFTKVAIYTWNYVGSISFREEVPSHTTVIILKNMRHGTHEMHFVHRLQQNRSYFELGAVTASEYGLPRGNHAQCPDLAAIFNP